MTEWECMTDKGSNALYNIWFVMMVKRTDKRIGAK